MTSGGKRPDTLRHGCTGYSSADGGVDVKIYSGQVEPYEDLAIRQA